MIAKYFSGPARNPEIQEIADRFFTMARLSIARAALAINQGADVVIAETGIERSALDFLIRYQELNPQAIPQLVDRNREEVYGGQVDFAAKETVAEQLAASGFFKDLRLPAEMYRLPDPDRDPDGWTDRMIEVLQPGEQQETKPPAPPNPEPPEAHRELRLKLARLDCVTLVPWEAADAFTLGNAMVSGGVGEDSTRDKVVGLEFFVHEFRKNGEGFDISPDRTLLKFRLGGSGSWPRWYTAVVSLAEQDNGGFHDFLARLWDDIGADVIKVVTTVVLAELGLETGAIAGSAIAPVIGTVVGAVIGAAIGLAVEWLINTFADDILSSVENPLTVVLSAADALLGGNMTTPISAMDFTLNRGRYLLSYYWELA